MAETIVEGLEAALEQRRNADPASSYVAQLYAGGAHAILDKVAEEATEVVEAGHGDDNAHLVHEVADLWFHTMVLLKHRGLSSEAVFAELGRRFGVSGLDEKAARGDGQ